MLRLILLTLLHWCSGSQPLRPCTMSDFLFEYTSCGENGERWRVAVPRSQNLNCEGNIPTPQRGLNCTFTCGAGNYLDIETQHCRECEAGSYSLGGGIRFDEFTHLPTGFTIENFDATEDRILETSTAEAGGDCPAEAGWQTRNADLIYSPSTCVSKLSFSTHLVRPGYVEYTYRMPTNSRGLSMNVVVRNEQCQSYRDEVRNLMSGIGIEPAAASHHEENNGEWQKKKIELRTGPNVISWTVTNSREYAASVTQPIFIGRIDILGMAFTRTCSACPPGTYSERGARECKPCSPGFFSTKGSDRCGKCPTSQYSGPKSPRCYDRPACTQGDFYPVTEACKNGKTRRTYKKVLPAVCTENVPGAAKLPQPEPERDCPACNPGMSLFVNGICSFCQAGEHSDGNKCTRCPPNSLPTYGYHYVFWNSLPPHITTRCEFITDESLASCDVGDAWLPSGDALVSAPSLQKGIALEAVLDVPYGFSNPMLPPRAVSSAENPIAALNIVFDTKCADDSCVLYFIEDISLQSSMSYYRFLAAFNGSQPRQVFSHPITRATPTRYMIAFIRSGSATGDDIITDQTRIYSVNVTNLGRRGGKQGGGAADCLPCAVSGNRGCVPCENGHYMERLTRVCLRCPPRTYANMSSSRTGVETCVPCGPNLDSDGTQCTTSGRFSILHEDNTTNSYDVRSLVNLTLTVSGVRVFAREGTSYFHQFNVSIGHRVTCADNFDQSELVNVLTSDAVEGHACRLTAIPTTLKNHTKKIGYISPLLLASSLAAITDEQEYGGWHISDESLGYAGQEASSRPHDVHFFFSTPPIRSDACPNGTGFVITARCEPNEKRLQLRLPGSCPDGTCDGCLYHMILPHASACPLCSPSEYKSIRGECIDGHQIIHSIPHKHCVVAGIEGEERKVTCSVLSANAQLIIIAGVVLLITLLLVLCTIWRRNQRLEYKYMKLVESQSGGYELAGAESCGIDENDEDEEEEKVVFSKSKKSGSGFFGRMQGKAAAMARNGPDAKAFVELENDED